jgi:hypothetical protein
MEAMEGSQGFWIKYYPYLPDGDFIQNRWQAELCGVQTFTYVCWGYIFARAGRKEIIQIHEIGFLPFVFNN